MATYYVRTDGNDSNTGTGATAATAWKTLTKALGTSGIGNGDTVWIAPGKYREVVTVAMTSPTVETFVYGDPLATKFSDVAPGQVILTSYTTDDNTVPNTACLNITAKSNLSFADIMFVGARTSAAFAGAVGISVSGSTASTNLKWTRCIFESATSRGIQGASVFGTTLNWTFDRCRFFATAYAVEVQLPRGTGSNYRIGLTINSCQFIGSIYLNATGTGANGGTGGVTVYNCYHHVIGNHTFEYGNDLGDTTNKVVIRNSIFRSVSTAMSATTAGSIDEDYNRIISGVRTNVTAGANSKSQAPCLDFGNSFIYGLRQQAVFAPVPNESIIGAGTATGAPTYDLYGNAFLSPPSIGPVESGKIAGNVLTHPGTAGGMRG